MYKKYLNILPLTISSISFLFIQLLFFNKGLNFRDEGFLLNNAIRILNGEIPYRDFFLTTTPGTYYLQSFIFKLFGIHIILDRVLYLFCIVILLLILNLLLGKTNLIIKSLILLLAGFTFTGIGAFAFYNIEGLIIFLFSIILYTKKDSSKYIPFLIGATLSLLFVFKQSYGIYALGTFICLFFINNFSNVKKQIIYILSGFTILILPFTGYLIWNKAFLQFIYFTSVFAKEVKMHRFPFILTSLIFIPLSLIFLYIIKKIPLQKALILLGIFLLGFFLLYIYISPARLGRILIYIKDPLIYYYGFLLIFPILIISQYINLKNNNILLYSACSLSLFLASASSGRDFTTVIIVFPMIILLCIELINVIHKKKFILIIIFYSLFPVIFFGISMRNLLTPEHYSELQLPQFEGILVPQSTTNDINSIVDYIQKQTSYKDTMICFPYCPLLNVLSQRENGSYFSFFYPETIRTKDQNRVISDIKQNKTKIIVLQKPGPIEKEALYENQRLSLIKRYFMLNFNPVFSSQNFIIYLKKE